MENWEPIIGLERLSGSPYKIVISATLVVALIFWANSLRSAKAQNIRAICSENEGTNPSSPIKF